MTAERPLSALPPGQAVADPAPDRHVRNVVARSGTSFFMGMRVLPPDRRRAMYAIYAFCREVDDIADEPGQPDDKRAALAEWRAEIARLYAGRPARPTARALLQPVKQFALPQEEFLAVIAGMETDTAQAVRMQGVDDLMDYCRKVAVAVGRLSVCAFGVPARPGPQIADALGNAFQLTNILRDMKKDADMNRLYLPGDLLKAHGVAADAPPHSVLSDPGLAGVCGALVSMARAQYAEGDRLLAQTGQRKMRAAVIMKEVYRRTLDRLEARGWQRLDDPVGLSRAQKVMLALRYGLL